MAAPAPSRAGHAAGETITHRTQVIVAGDG